MITLDVARGHVPNVLSLSRCFSPLYIPPLFFGGLEWIALPITTLVCLTDWADGYLARRWNCKSVHGALLDIFGDKILCYTLGGIGIVAWSWHWWYLAPFALFLSYDTYTITLRYVGNVTAPSLVAKAKTLMLFVALIVAISPLSTWDIPLRLGDYGFYGVLCLWFTAGMAVWSALHYWRYLPDIRTPRWLSKPSTSV